MFHENRKIEFGLLSIRLPHFYERDWKKTIKKETNKTQYNSLNNIFQIMRCHEH